MILYQCLKCNKSFLNGVDLSNHIEKYHEQISTAEEKKCPECASEKIVFIAKRFDGEKEKCHVYYCRLCNQALKIELN